MMIIGKANEHFIDFTASHENEAAALEKFRGCLTFEKTNSELLIVQTYLIGLL
jgi:hypothetical protein